MTLSELENLKSLIAAEWTGVHAMPVQDRRQFLLDIVFATTGNCYCWLAQNLELLNGEEVFHLVIHEFTPGGWWRDIGVGISNTWTPTNIKDKFESAGLASILSPPRRCRFFSQADLLVATQSGPTPYAAVEISATQALDPKRIVLAASQEFPFTLVLATTAIDCDALLQGLVELKPGADGDVQYEARGQFS